MVVSVGPYMLISTPPRRAPRSRVASSGGRASPPTSNWRTEASDSSPRDSVSSAWAREGVSCRWVTACRSRDSATWPCSASVCTTTLKPRHSVHSSSSTEMSKETLVTASQVPEEEAPRRASIPAKKLATLRCCTMTPLGVPVVPEV